MPADEYDALLRATRWSAATPFVKPDGSGPLGGTGRILPPYRKYTRIEWSHALLRRKGRLLD